MKLPELLKILPEYQSQAPEVEVLSLTHDARHVHLGSVFIAIPGTQVDGHQFLKEACESGAVAVIVEKAQSVPKDYTGFVQVVRSSREAVDLLAAQFYDHPSEKMFCFGVTGTNGKTSITYMLEAILSGVKCPCGVLGTINHHLADRIWPTQMTTPDPISLQKRLREMKDAGAKAIAMEVSSHALAQKRADGVHFNTVIFTNLTRDHLDYHKTMQEYFESKQRLFTDLMWKSSKVPSFAVVNTDDVWGARLKVAGDTEILTYGQRPEASFRYRITNVDFSRTDFELTTFSGTYTGWIPMAGSHNVANATAVVAAAATWGISISSSLEMLSRFQGVPGRLQSVPNNKSLSVFVDYAHTPDALESVLRALNQVRRQLNSHARIWTVFGCGGDRDKGKRPLMAQKALEGSDFVMVTSDNPRKEDPMAIISDIIEGVPSADRQHKVMMEADRRKAIEKVLAQAKPHDVILIAGKGHEDYQIIGNEKTRFSDYETAKELLL